MLVVAAGVAAVVAAGVGLRFSSRSDLWLDEALTVNLSRLPLSKLPDALRHDGAPPLFYVLLHGWMKVFGSGDAAVRALPGLLGVLALPLAWLAGRRLAGRAGAWTAVVLTASSPFAVRYATEVRMYSLVVVLALAGFLALDSARARPTPARLAAVAAVTGALLLTHYWSLFLVAAAAAVLLPGARVPGHPHRRCLAAVAAGGLFLLPWLPVLAYQAGHTGTPWASSPRLRDLVETAVGFAGGRTRGSVLLGVLYAGLVVAAVARRRRERPAAAGLAMVVGGTLAGAFAFGLATGSAFVPRYTSVVLGPLLLLLTLGAVALRPATVRAVVLAVVAVVGLARADQAVDRDRTHAGEVAAAIARVGRPGDVVAFCPDQLGPAVDRVLDPRYRSGTFPAGADPSFVDWVDYRERMAAGDPAAFAAALLAEAGAGTNVFLVWDGGYRTLGSKCEAVVRALDRQRPRRTLLTRLPRTGEPMRLELFPPSS